MTTPVGDSLAAQTAVPSINNSSDADSANTAGSGEEGSLYERNKELQEQFADEMREIATIKNHRKVAVLLLSWQKEGEDYMDLKEEVSINAPRLNHTLIIVDR